MRTQKIPTPNPPEGDRTAMDTLTRIFPCMTSALKTDADRVELVNQTIVEEVLQDFGTLDFGAGDGCEV